MMAKMFYTMEEAKSALGKSEDEIRQYAREGRLREFRDGPRLMFKADQVEQLKSELGGGGGLDQVDLGMSDSGGLIGLVDTTGASGTSITLSDVEGTGQSSSTGMPGLKMKDDTALAADLGLSGSLGGVPSPGRPNFGGAGSGTGLSGSVSGRSGAGINVFGSDEIPEPVDPGAQTAITGGIQHQMDLQGIGSGSGLLDLTRESDDTSLGAVLDEINPPRAGLGSPEGSLGSGLEDEEPAPRISAPPVYVQAPDALAPAFGGAALAAAGALVYGIFVLISSVIGTRPDAITYFDRHHQNMNVWSIAGIGLAGVLIFFIFGLIIGKMATSRR